MLLQIDEVMKEFQVSEENYVTMMGSLEAEMERGLHRDSHASASVRMFPTYVSSLPTGTGMTSLPLRHYDINVRFRPNYF